MVHKNNKLNICLIKKEITSFEEAVLDGVHAVEVVGVGTLYVDDSHPRPPDWIVGFFGVGFDIGKRLITSSARGVLLTSIQHGEERRIFAVIFGFGRHLLKDDVVEERFGLRIVLNAVDPESLRSIDKTSLGSVPKQTREQMSRDGGASNFGIDIEQDLINSVTGKSRDPRFGRTISGRDALAVSVRIDMDNILDFLSTCISVHDSDAYRVNFSWIDQIKDIRSRETVENLDERLVSKLKDEDYTKIWMAVPEIIDWVDVKEFKYQRPKRGASHEDIDIRNFLTELGDEELNAEILKHSKVFVISSRTEDVAHSWTAYKCLYAEIEDGGKLYVLNNGKWYEIVADFARQVNDDFVHIPESDIELPEYAHTDEAEYNRAATVSIAGACCMDGDVVVHGGGHSRIEFCDILTPDKKLIHVKRYGGSSTLSHLFSQGVTSGELFVADGEFRRLLNDKLPTDHKLANVQDRPDPRDYEIIFGVISKSNNPLDIPFFSKVSFRNAKRRLEGFGYKVYKKKIQITHADG